MLRFACAIALSGLLILTLLVFSGKQPTLSAADADQKTAESQDKDKKEKEDTPLAKYMRKKLKASNMILEGLVTENMKLVRNGAAQLEKMSKEEQFMVLNDAIYRQYSLDFQRSVEQLQKDAENASVDAASLTWIKTTLNCIECHKYTKGMLVSGP